jgi:hypothetical protein
VPICQLLGSPTSTPAKIPMTAATETRVVAVTSSAVVSPVIVITVLDRGSHPARRAVVPAGG